MIHRKIEMKVLKGKTQPVTSKSCKDRFYSKLLTVGGKAELHSDLCKGD